MEWVEVTAETVREHMGVEIRDAYDKWIVAFPDKAGRLEDIVEEVRTEFRDAIASKSKNWLHPDKTYLPQSAVRHCENIVQYTLGMEMGVTLTVDGRTLLTRADMYLRQIVYGHNRFADENDSDETTPSYSVPSSKGRALGDLVALLLGAFLWCLPARAAWIQEKNETTYIPANYDITEQSLNGHLAGIDTAFGFLSDTNSLYGRLVGLPQLVYDLLDSVETGSLYGQYVPQANAWHVLNQTNLYFQGTLSAPRVVVGNIYGEDGLTVNGNADVTGDVSVGSLTIGDSTWDHLPDVGDGDLRRIFFIQNDGWQYDERFFGAWWAHLDDNILFPVGVSVTGFFLPHLGISFLGTTNTLTYSGGKLLFGGAPIATGIANLTAGHGINLSTNLESESVGIAVARNIDFDNVTIWGDLSVNGTEYHNTIIRHETNVYVGIRTNYVTTDVYTTNHVYQYVHVVTRSTNYVDEIINIGGNADYSAAASVLLPGVRIDNTDTNHPSWDFSGVSLDAGAFLSAGTNIVFSYTPSGVLSINASVPEIDLSGYAPVSRVAAVEGRVGVLEGQTNSYARTSDLSSFVTSNSLAETLADYAPASQITIITNDIDEIVSALSHPVIQTPDHRKWTMQGRYSNGQVTHVWVPYVGAYSTPIRISMPDRRIFEMVGRYADGNTNVITHAWQEVLE